MSWNPGQYSKFEAERNRPVRDLLAQIHTAKVTSAADIGCGPGNSTELLQAAYPSAVVTGMDNSAEMIEAAKKRLPGVRFEIADIAAWDGPARYDVVLANAALQWVPDHEAVLPKLFAKVAPGGSLAVQIPDNLDEPAHRVMREVAAEGAWAAKLAEASRARAVRRDAEWYYRVLRECGASVDVWRTVYHHVMAKGAADLVEWFKGTGLRPFLDPLDADEKAGFLDRYQAALAKAYPTLADGSVLLPFPRLFFVAARS